MNRAREAGTPPAFLRARTTLSFALPPSSRGARRLLWEQKAQSSTLWTAIQRSISRGTPSHAPVAAGPASPSPYRESLPQPSAGACRERRDANCTPCTPEQCGAHSARTVRGAQGDGAPEGGRGSRPASSSAAVAGFSPWRPSAREWFRVRTSDTGDLRAKDASVSAWRFSRERILTRASGSRQPMAAP